MKNKLISLFVLFILISSVFTLAENTAVTSPSFWEKVSVGGIRGKETIVGK